MLKRCIVATRPHLKRSLSMSATALIHNGIEYRRLERAFDPVTLYEFNVLHGSTPHNFIPEGPVRDHLSKLKTGEAIVWGAFETMGDQQLVGMLTAEVGGGYWVQTGAGGEATCFVNEFVVDASYRGRAIGSQLTSLSVHPTLGIFGLRPEIAEMYTTVHSDNVASRSAFVKGGYHEVRGIFLRGNGYTHDADAHTRDPYAFRCSHIRTCTGSATQLSSSARVSAL